ncbi:MAG: hypothetical protein CMB48_00140 [Euryarchaeota archaeon]|nr:hypothetical protein [Euryarchaeota archaeon]
MDDDKQTKLPFGEEDINALFDAEDVTEKRSVKPFSKEPLKGVIMPSLNNVVKPVKKTNIIYHDLGLLYPNANVSNKDGFIIHRANLLGKNGIFQLFNWASDGDVSIVDLKDILSEDEILSEIVIKLNQFIIEDLGGEILQLSETRLLILPPSCKGMKGLEDEAFVH